MRWTKCWRASRRISGVLLILLTSLNHAAGALLDAPFHGFNVIASPQHPFGGRAAHRSLTELKGLGANVVAIVPFLWQASPTSERITRGGDMPDDMLRAAIKQARSLGLSVIVKPHVWVPESWAGAVAPASEDGWRTWFAGYEHALERIARVAAQERADALVIGTELVKTSQRPEWLPLIERLRAVYSGTLIYAAHNVDEAETVPFWNKLDAIGVSLYPPLGDDRDRAGRVNAMRALAQRLDDLSRRTGKQIIVAEIGLRSAVGAAAKPWESAEERVAPVDAALQAQVLTDWLAALDRPSIRGVLVWRWFTDPDAGGPADTDFTVQHKPAEEVLRCAWAHDCRAVRSELVPKRE